MHMYYWRDPITEYLLPFTLAPALLKSVCVRARACVLLSKQQRRRKPWNDITQMEGNSLCSFKCNKSFSSGVNPFITRCKMDKWLLYSEKTLAEKKVTAFRLQQIPLKLGRYEAIRRKTMWCKWCNAVCLCDIHMCAMHRFLTNRSKLKHCYCTVYI